MFKADPTLTHYTRPWKERMERLRNASSSWSHPAATLEAIDVYLLNEMVRRTPNRPVVIDLAADFTNGGSSLCFSEEIPPALLACPRNPWSDIGSIDWREAHGRLTAAGILPGLVSEGTALNEILRSPMATVSPVAFLVTAPGPETDKLESRLQELTSLCRDASLWILDMGKVGECPVWREAESFCMKGKGTHRMVLPREYSPFLHTSRLCIVEPVTKEDTKKILEELSVLFDGNFGFLDLARRLSETEMRNSAEMNAFYNPSPKKDESPGQSVRRFMRRLLKG